MYNQKVILCQPGTAMLRFVKRAVFNFATCNPFNTLHFHSNANKKVIYT